MKIIALTVALTLMATLAASGDDVSFAAPPLPRPANPTLQTWSASGDIMGETQLRHIKRLLAVWRGLRRPPNPFRAGRLAPPGMFLGSAGKGRFFVPA